jgi:Rps23 Pro-64 3,4-dihydroxylase Tpa1-like proline 4-hydroxylase
MTQAFQTRSGVPQIADCLSPGTVSRLALSREAFHSARPFRHVLIDSFFAESFAEQLLADFPPFDAALAKNEIYGGVWGKAANPKIRAIAPVYRKLYDLIESQAFLDFISRITGIPDLLFDPAMFGGGTHENLHGQDLDPHVDFNYDEARRLHRRLNLIVYLNKEWLPEWGGSLELHSNPRKPEENHCQSFSPIFNRAVLFETNEYSWHGFPRIELPVGERHRSRKSISIYLYTRTRPAGEIAPAHGTFYVQRPLEDWVRPGHVLTEDECRELRHAVDRRDKWIATYQNIELRKSGQLEQHAAYLREILSRLRAPLTGYVMQEGAAEGLYADGWTQPKVSLRIRPLRPVTGLRLRGWLPDSASPQAELIVHLNGRLAAQAALRPGVFELELASAKFPTADAVQIDIGCDRALRGQGDDRELAFVLTELRAEHG